jgi:hypothetical protein
MDNKKVPVEKYADRYRYTVGDLKRDLAIFNNDMEIYFEGFNFERLKRRGDKLLQIEISEKEYENE